MSSRYITRLELENFQGHKNSVVDFTTGVNTFQGETDMGKSTCIKAIEWVHSNKIVGERPTTKIHHDSIKTTTKGGNMKLTGDTIVRVLFNDRHIIEKIKGKDQVHNITYPDGRTLQLTGTGMTVPDEVTAIFNFTDINHSTQAEEFFILFDTPISIAKKLNEITDLTLGDKLLTLIKSETRALNSKKNLLAEDIARITKDVEQYKDLPLMEEELDTLEELEEELHKTDQKIKEMNEVLTTYNKYTEELQIYSNLEEYKHACSNLIELATKVKNIRDKHIEQDSYLKDITYLLEKKIELSKIDEQKKEIDNLILDKNGVIGVQSKISEMENAIDEVAKYQNRLNVDFKPVQYSKDLDELIQLCKDFTVKKNCYSEADKLLQDFLVNYNKKITVVKDIEVLQKELGDALKDACPLCGRSCKC